ncbi:hypothetical protein VCRA2114E365_10470 [Vibrio crassostreae]|nr:hypothetical protein VCRA2117O376_10145 [Vibrio crassostreae]CAK1843535.1 hypothetical protein VCRA2114O369_10144 [Vibrio crassostreae]CAK1847416.1 hypothetical protein VCRA2113O357_10146 [Vibrio crassostreae]CAK1849297.1 hypothetical protein VCRA2113O359_10146 [Vibrio crassostreae]CAK1851476.1 hypothetical protein VCRA2113O363_10145 [Vibrio crassostreae]
MTANVVITESEEGASKESVCLRSFMTLYEIPDSVVPPSRG